MSKRTRILIGFVTFATVPAMTLLAGGASPPSGVSALVDQSDGRNWAAFGRTFGEQHFSPLADINDKTIGRLHLAWYVDLPPEASISAPLAIDGVLYTATGHSVVRAWDAGSGRRLWEFDPKAPEASGMKLRQGWGSRGLAWWNGKLYVGTQDGRLIAIDARTGREIWSQLTVSKDDLRFISGAPRVFDGKVIIGHGGADAGDTRGYVTTYDAETGKQLWRFYTVPGNPADGFENDAMEMAAKTWSGQWWKFGGGGTVWNAMTYDARTDTVYIGTGNGSPWNHRVRSQGEGDNLFLCSIVALDAKTGRYKWHYQINPGESWDYNAAMDMELADLDISGQRRQVLMTAPKNGFFYVIDRITGKLISAEPIAKVSWASKIDLATGRPVEMPGIRYADSQKSVMWPGTAGAHNWLPMSFDPRTGIAYIPKIEMATIYDDKGIDTGKWRRPSGNFIDGANHADMITPLPGAGTSALLAWDVRRQKPLWSVPTPGFWNGGTMATAGNLVFQGHADGSFNAFASDSGKKLWRFDAQVGVLAPPITYRARGRQYVTVLTGFGGAGAILGEIANRYGWDYRSQKRRILTFALDGKASLPPASPTAAPVEPDTDFAPDAALVAEGQAVYGARCTYCHGVFAVAAGLAPDLRRSPIVRDKDAFAAIVHGGALVPNGMPQFAELSDRELESIRQYVRSENRKSLRK
ncbi:PQQ-dependent dehydrogenase, methanol/ethanol family [Rhizorhabdus histidinilytica]|nr:PQQ-dependent dehydrogenase, methanol/ethanol family [Rhizorhabdus histidinilytica]